jgi:hypothetical protein
MRAIERIAYEVDAVHDELGIVVEVVEAGRGALGDAVCGRDNLRDVDAPPLKESLTGVLVRVS